MACSRAVFLTASSMSTIDNRGEPGDHVRRMASWLHLPQWYALLLIPSAVVYCIAMVAETNRAPFDLVECEQSWSPASSPTTRASATRSTPRRVHQHGDGLRGPTDAVLGGYRAPWPIRGSSPSTRRPVVARLRWMGLFWFTFKLLIFIGLFVWLRGTLPRFRYDQFMDLGWKVLIPISIAWIVLVSFVRIAQSQNWLSQSS